ncbi:YgaP family membrane protein [Alicyclobacillus acidocaldarius]|uniref:YgaP family membrane protein n=1 Tax=Alicyclobacillus acidocaldarius TaxID=405212 RepID=UPI00345F0978
MQRNIHPADRYLRLAAGVASLSSAVYGRRQSALTRALLAGFGAMKIAEAITGFCPMKASMERMAKPSGDPAEAPRKWMEKVSTTAENSVKQISVKQIAEKAQDMAAKATDRVQAKSDTPIPDEVAEFLVEGSNREPSDEDNA